MNRAPNDEWLREQYRSMMKREYGVADGDLLEPAFDESILSEAGSAVKTSAVAFEGLRRGCLVSIAHFNWHWRRLLSEQIALIPDRTVLDTLSVLVGEVPETAFSARMQDFGQRRFWILLHRGLALYAFRIATVVIGTARFSNGSETYEPEISMNEGQRMARAELEYFLIGRHGTPLELRTPVHIKAAILLTELFERFILAHELGHILLRLPEARSTELTGDPKLEELAADAVGFSIYRLHMNALSCDVPPEILVPLINAAPALLFRFMDRIERVAAAQKARWSDTHPPADTRLTNLRFVQRRLGMLRPSDFELDTHLANIFQE